MNYIIWKICDGNCYFPEGSNPDNHVFSPYNGSTSSRNDSYKSPLPTLSEANSEHDLNEEPRYLSVSSRCDPGPLKKKEEKYEYIPLKEMDSLPKRGIEHFENINMYIVQMLM